MLDNYLFILWFFKSIGPSCYEREDSVFYTQVPPEEYENCIQIINQGMF